MAPDEPWQGTIVEAPDMVEVNGAYWLLYSGNWFNQPAYGIGVAWCAGPSGPCADTSDQPLLGSNAPGTGAGRGVVLPATPAGVWMLYTPVRLTTTCRPSRPVDITRIGFAPRRGLPGRRGPPARRRSERPRTP